MQPTFFYCCPQKYPQTRLTGHLDGETSCLTLAPVIRYKAQNSVLAAEQIARLLPALGGQRRRGDEHADALKVAQRVEGLVTELGLAQCSLLERGVGQEQVDVIAGRATGGSPTEPIIALVWSLF